ncbi:MAG: hypothetical protein HXS44_07145 [Theionarchaea archaeon]|nr:hypothetical protein [Theionarchaea archaeon]
MGFTDKLAGMLKKKGVRVRESVHFEGLASYIAQEISEEEERIVKESADAVEAIMDSMKELSQFLERLKEMEREEMFKRLDMIVRSSQKRFAESLKNVVARVHLESKDYNGLKKFHEVVTDALAQIQKLNRMHGRYLYVAFDKEMKTFSKTAKEIVIYNHMLEKLMRSEGVIIDEFRLIEEMILDREKTIEEIARIDKERAEIQKAIQESERNVQKCEEELNRLQSSKEYESLARTEQKHEALMGELKSVEGEIYNILHPLDRDFRKFRRQVDLGNFPFDVRLLEQYEQLTEQFLKEEEGYPDLKKIAEKMKEALQNQVIKEKGHKKEKVLDILESVLNDGLLELQQKYHGVKAQLEVKPVKSNVMEKLESVERDIKEKTNRISDLRKKENSLISKKKDLEDNIQKMEEEIREKCDEIGIQVE